MLFAALRKGRRPVLAFCSHQPLYQHLVRMRWITCFFLLWLCLPSNRSFAQAPVPPVVSLQVTGVSLADCLQRITQQTNITFVYTDDLLLDAAPVTVKLQRVPVATALLAIFAGRPLTYKQVQQTIIISRKFNSSIRPADTLSIHGTVRSGGKPLANVSVMLARTSLGTLTVEGGSFTLAHVTSKAPLIFSAVGYETQTLSFDVSRTMQVTMVPSSHSLDEVQVIGYGTTTARLATGAIDKVSAATIAQQPITNALEALEGRVPGLFITQNSGLPGTSFSIQLRGQNSIGSGNDPYYLIDGVPFLSSSLVQAGNIINQGSPLNNLNPADIESITILKDADATAIYGSRGANGVILITTKSGKAGKTKIDVNTSFGLGQVTRKMSLLQTPDYLAMRHEAFAKDGVVPDPSVDVDLLAWDTTRQTDWQRALIGGTAQFSTAQVSVSGGNAQTQILYGFVYDRQTTVFPGDFNNQRASGHAKITHRSEDGRFTSSITATFASDWLVLPQLDLTPIALSLPPNAPAHFTSNGELNWENNTWFNPYASLRQPYHSRTNNLLFQGNWGYALTPSLNLSVSAGYNSIDLDEKALTPMSSYAPAQAGLSGVTAFGTNRVQSLITEPQLTFTRKIGAGHLSVLAGSTFQERRQTGSVLLATGYTNDALLNDLQAAPRLTVLQNSATQYRYAALFGRIHYDYQSRLLFNLTGRRDASSRFGPGKQFAQFGALGAAWIFTREPSRGLLSFGKIRASYGSTGNDQIPDYGFLDVWHATAYPYAGNSGLYPTNLQNPNFAWEINRKSEVGLDLGFLKQAISFSLSYYRNRSSNQLVGYALPSLTGFTSVTGNLPAVVRNTGLELSITTRNVSGKRFTWTSSFTLAVPRNRLVAYPYLDASSYANTYALGRSLFIQKRLHYTGVDPNTGIYLFADVDGNGSDLDYPQDLQAIKQVAPRYYGGLQNSLGWGHWQLDIFIQFVQQTGFTYLATSTTLPGMFGNQPTQVLSRWRHPGQDASVQRFSQAYTDAFVAYSYAAGLSDLAIGNASFVRLKNVSFSYSLPDRWKKGWLTFGKCFVQAQNLLTITRYFGLDPENNASGKLPPLRVVTAGIQLTF